MICFCPSGIDWIDQLWFEAKVLRQ